MRRIDCEQSHLVLLVSQLAQHSQSRRGTGASTLQAVTLAACQHCAFLQNNRASEKDSLGMPSVLPAASTNFRRQSLGRSDD